MCSEQKRYCALCLSLEIILDYLRPSSTRQGMNNCLLHYDYTVLFAKLVKGDMRVELACMSERLLLFPKFFGLYIIVRHCLGGFYVI